MSLIFCSFFYSFEALADGVLNQELMSATIKLYVVKQVKYLPAVCSFRLGPSFSSVWILHLTILQFMLVSLLFAPSEHQANNTNISNSK